MKTVSILLAGVCSCTSMSCLNPFAPKLETDIPAKSCYDLTMIENVYCSFHDAYAFKDTLLYGSLLAPEFSFSYRDYDRGVDVSWGRDDEMRSTHRLFESVQSLNLIWNNRISSDSTETRWSIIRGFNLTVTFNPGDIERVDGYANFTMTREHAGDAWRIFHWRDESNF